MSITSDLKKISKATRRASKAASKLGNQLNKKISKAVQQKAKQKERDKKKKAKQQEKLLQKQQELLNKVKANLKTATDRMMDAEMHDIPAYSYFNPIQSKENLEKMQNMINSGKLLSKKNLEYLKQASNKTYYDQMIKYELEEDKFVSQKEINRIRNKQTKRPLTETEENLLNKWASATERSTNVNKIDKVKPEHFSPDSGQKPEESEDEYIERRKREVRRIKVDREITVGGNSKLINDLWYTSECGEVGRRVFTLVQNAMRDPVAWNDIEAWYRRNYKAQDALQARGNDWYESVVHGFLTMFIDFLNELAEKINIDDEIMEEYETQLAEYID